MRILELFSGIGGVAEAVRQSPELGCIHQAVDIDQQCGRVYEHNFALPPVITTIESPHSWQANIDWRSTDTWWLSPPCQPYCRRGRQSPDDPRRAAFVQVMQVLQSAGSSAPSRIALENVPEFQYSDDHQQWLNVLSKLGYGFTEHCLCPSAWQLPNRRRRYYLTAWRAKDNANGNRDGSPPAVHPPPPASDPPRLSMFLDKDVDASLGVEPERIDAFKSALHIVDAQDDSACTACFTGGYGKSLKQAGSYLRVDGRLRRFSPLEIQRLLGYDETAFTWPEGISIRRKWKMLGNSVSVPVVREVLRSLL